jgi:hypothetical protein
MPVPANMTSASRWIRGKTSVARLPAATAAAFEGVSSSITRANGAASLAAVAVASVHPLQTTTTSSRPGASPRWSVSRVRRMTRSSLWAGMTTLAMTGAAWSYLGEPMTFSPLLTSGEAPASWKAAGRRTRLGVGSPDLSTAHAGPAPSGGHGALMSE